MTNSFMVTKRMGNLEPFDADKINKVVQWAVENINGVSASDLIMNSHLQLFDKIKTDEIHSVLINSASSMITEETPNYQYVAARLAIFDLRKKVFGHYKPIPLFDHINICVGDGVYDKKILKWYSEDDVSKFDNLLKHNRDYDFTYAGVSQMEDKYLVKDRKTGKVHETPQYAFMLIAMTLFHEYEGSERYKYVRDFYNAISRFKINLPTPVIAGVRTNTKQYSSCTLIDVDDTLDSIVASTSAMCYYTAMRAGIGINIGRIRSIGATVRGGEVISTGIIPYLKLFESSIKCTSQAGVRSGSATAFIPFWHAEIEDAMVLKNNRGTEDNRVRKLDYCVQLSKLFYQRFINDEQITLFSPNDVPELYEAFGMPEFDEIYEACERRWSINNKKVRARDLMKLIAKERVETGRIYIQNIDHCNSHSSFNVPVRMSNLCTEITLPTTPLQHIDDEDGEIAICVLGGINLGTTSFDEFPAIANLLVRALDYVIDNQDYPVKAAEKEKQRRSIGIGLVNYAYWLAKQNLRYGEPDALAATDEMMERYQYALLEASNNLAKEKGACDLFNETKYSDGILPIDTYNKKVDSLTKHKSVMDWKSLRKSIKKHGLRNSALTAIMPAESSAVVSNATNGIEPARALLTVKKSKQGLLRLLVPEYSTLKNRYDIAFTFDNRKMISTVAVMQKWIDQTISANLYNAYANYEDGNLPLSEVISDILYAYSLGVKTLYYHHTEDGNSHFDDVEAKEELGCASGACSL